MNVYHYRTLETNFHLEAVEVDFLLWRPRHQRFSPFSGWTASDPPLRWYGDCNITEKGDVGSKTTYQYLFYFYCDNVIMPSWRIILCLFIIYEFNFFAKVFCSQPHVGNGNAHTNLAHPFKHKSCQKA